MPVERKGKCKGIFSVGKSKLILFFVFDIIQIKFGYVLDVCNIYIVWFNSDMLIIFSLNSTEIKNLFTMEILN